MKRETPIIKGKDAERFLKMKKQNEENLVKYIAKMMNEINIHKGA